MWIRICLVGLAVIGCASATAAQGHAADAVTAFARSERGGIVVNATLDGRGPFRFLLDTGSTHTVITERVADAVGVRAIARALMTSAAGARMVPIVAIDRLTLGPVAMRVLPSVVSRLPVDGEADGLLGQDVLGGRRYTIDHGRKVIIWHDDCPQPVDPGALVLPLEDVQGRFVVEATIDARPVRLVIDTASEALILFVETRRRGAAATIVDTVSGREAAWIGPVGTLRLGEVEQTGVVAVHITRDLAPGQPDGLLPLHGFRRVTVDGPGRRLVVVDAR